jgi:hypothetical protein
MSAEYPIFEGPRAEEQESRKRIDSAHDFLQKAIAEAEELIKRSKKLARRLEDIESHRAEVNGQKSGIRSQNDL